MEKLSERLSDVLYETIGALSQVEEDIIKAAVDRLAAYEGTGYSPEDFDKFCRDMSSLRAALGLKTDEETLDAIQDGRLLVLQCKVGDTVYRSLARGWQTEVVQYIGVDSNGGYIGTNIATYRGHHIGDILHFSREEAERCRPTGGAP